MYVDYGIISSTIKLTRENVTPNLSVWFGEIVSPCIEYLYDFI
jgi:hypothetical protein